MSTGWGGESALLVGISLLYGLAIGSFLNVVIHRLPAGESIVFPASRCPVCRTRIAPWHNLPVLSYLLLRGRCHSCGVRISLRYPLIELFTASVFAAVAWRFGWSWLTPTLMVFAAGLIVAAVIDFDHQIIPDEISLGGIVLGLLVVPGAHAAMGTPWLDALQRSALGGVLGGGLLWTVAFVHARVSVALGRTFEHWPGEGEEIPKPMSADYWLWFPGMGLGDIKLLAMIGVFLGAAGVLETIVAASVLGLLLGLCWALATRSLSSPFGFGPAIAAGALLVLLVPVGLGL